MWQIGGVEIVYSPNLNNNITKVKKKQTKKNHKQKKQKQIHILKCSGDKLAMVLYDRAKGATINPTAKHLNKFVFLFKILKKQRMLIQHLFKL